jgi:hypothetical protein
VTLSCVDCGIVTTDSDVLAVYIFRDYATKSSLLAVYKLKAEKIWSSEKPVTFTSLHGVTFQKTWIFKSPTTPLLIVLLNQRTLRTTGTKYACRRKGSSKEEIINFSPSCLYIKAIKLKETQYQVDTIAESGRIWDCNFRMRRGVHFCPLPLLLPPCSSN